MSIGGEREWGASDFFAADAIAAERAEFLRRTYAHLFGAILGFMGLEALLLNTPALAIPILRLASTNFLFVFLGFMAAGWIAERWAQSSTSRAVQYAGLALYTVAEAVIFVPLLILAQRVGPDVIPNSAILTGIIFGGLTGVVLFTKADFSFLRTGLWLCSLAALGIMVAGMIFGFSMGLFLPAGMILLMSGYILYYTSNVLHHYRTDQYVAASLALFASVATLFWYIISLMSRLSRN